MDQPLTHPTMLEKSCVWGQQQCRSGTEMAANVVVSVQGKVNDGIQVELRSTLFRSSVLSLGVQA